MNNDLISRSALLENYGLKNAMKYGNETVKQQHNSYSTLMLYEIAEMIEDAPAVDAVEVVRCKDCVHYRPWLYGDKICGLIGSYHGKKQPDDYCSRGRKRK